MDDATYLLAQCLIDIQAWNDAKNTLRSFTFVLIGARPGKTPSAPWHAFDAVMVENAP